MIGTALATVGGGILLAWGFAMGIDKFSPSLKTRKKEAMIECVIDMEDGGYKAVKHPACPATADELIERIGPGIREPAGK